MLSKLKLLILPKKPPKMTTSKQTKNIINTPTQQKHPLSPKFPPNPISLPLRPNQNKQNYKRKFAQITVQRAKTNAGSHERRPFRPLLTFFLRATQTKNRGVRRRVATCSDLGVCTRLSRVAPATNKEKGHR